MLRQPDTCSQVIARLGPVQRLVGQLQLQSEVPFVLGQVERAGRSTRILRVSRRLEHFLHDIKNLPGILYHYFFIYLQCLGENKYSQLSLLARGSLIML